MRQFAEFFHCSPEKLGPDHIRQYQLHLLTKKKLSVRSVRQRSAALRFLYVKTLRRRYLPEHIPYPKDQPKLPLVLNREEVQRMIECTPNLMHRAMLMTLYSAGLRRSELTRLQVQDIDSQRILIHVHQGKGGRDRDVPLSTKLLEILKEYWLSRKPKTYLPVSDKVVWWLCRQAARAAGIKKDVHPHTLRHSYATHLLEAGAELVTIQTLLGHRDLRHTIIYLHLSTRYLSAVQNPLDGLSVDPLADVSRARKNFKK